MEKREKQNDSDFDILYQALNHIRLEGEEKVSEKELGMKKRREKGIPENKSAIRGVTLRTKFP